MPETKHSATIHDSQTNAAAESIRNLVKRHNLRSGVNQADIERFNQELEQIAVSLEEQGKSEQEVAEMREERGAAAPEQEQKTTAELVQQTIEESKKEDERRRKAGEPIPGQPVAQPAAPPATGKPNVNDPNANRLGLPATPSQPTTQKRDAVESTLKDADDKVRKTTETASKK